MEKEGIRREGTSLDQKMRWGGWLENPFISNIQRGLLDMGRISGLRKALEGYHCKNILDVGCGAGEESAVCLGAYFGLDNSFARVRYASQKHMNRIILGDANSLPFLEDVFEMVLLSNTSHHLSDRELSNVFSEMKRVSSKYVILNDAVKVAGQNPASKFFYRLDRGGSYRTQEEIKQVLGGISGLRLVHESSFWTFQRLYYRTVFVYEVINSA